MVRTALKGTFWLYLTFEMEVLGLIRWECRFRAYSGDPAICWCSAISRKGPDFSGSGGEGGDVRCCDQQRQNKSECNVDAGGASVRKGVLKWR